VIWNSHQSKSTRSRHIALFSITHHPSMPQKPPSARPILDASSFNQISLQRLGNIPLLLRQQPIQLLQPPKQTKRSLGVLRQNLGQIGKKMQRLEQDFLELRQGFQRVLSSFSHGPVSFQYLVSYVSIERPDAVVGVGGTVFEILALSEGLGA